MKPTSLTLLPGTVILTGTPEGVGFKRKPPLFLHEGALISVEIEGIGRLSNPVWREPSLENPSDKINLRLHRIRKEEKSMDNAAKRSLDPLFRAEGR